MNSIRIFSLFSGSTGNAFLIRTPSGDYLIDAGKSARRLCTAIREAGSDPCNIKAIFLTHEHSDHIGALSRFLKEHPVPVHLHFRSAPKLEADEYVCPCLLPHPPIWEGDFDGMRVQSFPTPHDSKGSVGYRFDIPDGNGKVFSFGYATDLGYVTDDVRRVLLGCRAVILESNHDPELLQNGPYPADLKRRIASRYGHLSNSDAAAFCAELCQSGARSLMLAHLSLDNNTPELALAECCGVLGDDAVSVLAAAPEEITELPLEELL